MIGNAHSLPLIACPRGQAPQAGALFKNDALADTYSRIVEASEGAPTREAGVQAARDAFYRGFVAEAIDRFCRTTEVMDGSGAKHRGVLSADDMAGYAATSEEPTWADYHGWSIAKTGPWGQGPVLLQALETSPSVLLIDELDKADVEIEGLLLEVLGDFQVTVPELGTIRAAHRPFVVLTSNATRELSEALRRRCLYLHIDYPEAGLEERIVRLSVPGIDDALAASVVRLVAALRRMRLRKSPSVSETVDWARTLIALGADSPDLDPATVRRTLGVLLKHREDVETAVRTLDLDRPLDGA